MILAAKTGLVWTRLQGRNQRKAMSAHGEHAKSTQIGWKVNCDLRAMRLQCLPLYHHATLF